MPTGAALSVLHGEIDFPDPTRSRPGVGYVVISLRRSFEEWQGDKPYNFIQFKNYCNYNKLPLFAF